MKLKNECEQNLNDYNLDAAMDKIKALKLIKIEYENQKDRIESLNSEYTLFKKFEDKTTKILNEIEEKYYEEIYEIPYICLKSWKDNDLTKV